jgi:hypothetical protein
MSKAIKYAATAVVALVALTFAGAAEAQTSSSKLLRAYQPVTVFDPVEQFRPRGVDSFLENADLERFDGRVWQRVDAELEDDELPEPGTGLFRLNERTCSPAAPVGGLTCYAAAATAAGGKGIVYGRVVRSANAVVLQYWFFYYDNLYSYQHPPTDFLWQAHEGDWEVVNVILSADEQPREVAYSQHCLGGRRAWDATTRRDGTHPVVYVGAGSHANYFSPGTHAIDVRCIPPQAVALLLLNGLPLPVDFTGDGAVAGPRAAGGEVTKIRRLGEETEWLEFDGFWGELQYFHSPFTGTVPLGTSPVGPAYHAVWRDPLGTVATWPLN